MEFDNFIVVAVASGLIDTASKMMDDPPSFVRQR